MNIRDMGYLRRQRIKKIKERTQKIEYQSYRKFNYIPVDDKDFIPGKIIKVHYGYLGRGGTNVKTNTRKDMRHTGIKEHMVKLYNYKRHDYQQVERMKIEENEYKKGELI